MHDAERGLFNCPLPSSAMMSQLVKLTMTAACIR